MERAAGGSLGPGPALSSDAMRSRAPSPLALLVSSILIPLSGCEDEKKPDAGNEPIVGTMELPIALRNGDDPPSPAAEIVISPKALHVDGDKEIELESGRVPESARSGTTLAPLAANLGSSSAATIRAHVSTPYLTTALVLSTLADKGVDEAGFQVRKGTGAETGWLVLEDFDVAPRPEKPQELEGGTHPPWDTVAKVWTKIASACGKAHSVHCDGKPSRVAKGGKTNVVLRARGSAVKLALRRFGVDEDDEEDEESGGSKRAGGGGAQMIEGVPAPQVGSKKEKKPEPATEATFMWRFPAVTQQRSPVKGALRPLCGSARCNVVVVADGPTATMRMISFLGAAFPDGTPSPRPRFTLPDES